MKTCIKSSIFHITFFLFTGLNSILAQSESGEIVEIDSYQYQIEYSNQLYKIYFSTVPANYTLDNLDGTSLTKYERYEYVKEVKAFLDNLPVRIRLKYASVTIFFNHILSPNAFGYHIGGDIIIESEEFKLNRYNKGGNSGPIQRILSHELGHHFEDMVGERQEIKLLKDEFESFRRLNRVYYDTYRRSGYINEYSYDQYQGKYSFSEEFADFYSLFLTRDSLLYDVHNRYPALARKVDLYETFLEVFMPEIVNPTNKNTAVNKPNNSLAQVTKPKSDYNKIGVGQRSLESKNRSTSQNISEISESIEIDINFSEEDHKIKNCDNPSHDHHSQRNKKANKIAKVVSNTLLGYMAALVVYTVIDMSKDEEFELFNK